MAADAVPAAVPDPPNVPAATPSGGAQPGPFSSLLSAVAPARTAPDFDLGPTAAAAEDGQGTAAASGSSVSYHDDGNTPQGDSTRGSNSTQKQGIWRAWLLAGAERWRKGAGANIKRMELAKAKAQARQVKVNRQVSVNRSGGLLGKTPGGAGAGGNSGGKSLNSKSAGGGAPKGLKNSSGKVNNGPSGRSGGSRGTGSGTNSGGGSGSGSGGNRGPGGGGGSGPTGRGGAGGGSPKPPKDKTSGGTGDGTKPPKSGKTGDGSGGSGNSTGAGRSSGGGLFGGGKNSKSTGTGKGGQQGPAGSPGKDARRDGPSIKSGGSKGTPSGKDHTAGPDLKKKINLKKTDAKPDSEHGKKQAPKDGKPPAPVGGKDCTPPGAAGGKTPNRTPASKTNGKPFTTKESRTTGYRDGSLAARTVAHAKAYRDGAKDGWHDTSEAADREKTRLDKAHETRKKTLAEARDKEQQVTGQASSADYHQAPADAPAAGPQSIPVKDVTATHVILGDGAARDSLTRGEVRSLKSFERRLEAKVAARTANAEKTKALKAHAEAQAAKATQLLEDARAVKGGDKLLGKLAKLQEAALVQASRADEAHTRAVRAADATQAVLVNIKTRYGAMYQAVIDSPEISPAETAFYLGDRNG